MGGVVDRDENGMKPFQGKEEILKRFDTEKRGGGAIRAGGWSRSKKSLMQKGENPRPSGKKKEEKNIRGR